MVIYEDEFKPLKMELEKALEYGADTVMCKKWFNSEDNLKFCVGDYDIQLFYHHHYYDGERYKGYNVRDLYETMIMVEKNKIQPLNYVDEMGREYPNTIDLGKIMDERMLLLELHHQMAKADWFYDYSDDGQVRMKGALQINHLEKQLELFSKTQYGLTGANLLWELYAPKENYGKPSFLNVGDRYVFDSQEKESVKRQLKIAGMIKAFTPQLEMKLVEGTNEVKQSYNRNYGGDRANVLLHLVKSPSSNKYLLQKFDVSLQKKGLNKKVSQTFYVNSPSQDPGINKETAMKFTLKQAYNYLDGRPVLVSHHGQNSLKWKAINFKKMMDNGVYEMIEYTGVSRQNIEAILNRYSIKELKNKHEAKLLHKKLENGEMVKVTFMNGSGKSEKMYVALNLNFETLQVLDQYKHLISKETLSKKHFLTQQLSKYIDPRNESENKFQHKVIGKEKSPYINWQKVEKFNQRYRPQ